MSIGLCLSLQCALKIGNVRRKWGSSKQFFDINDFQIRYVISVDRPSSVPLVRIPSIRFVALCEHQEGAK
jgi:hypothetical protein